MWDKFGATGDNFSFPHHVAYGKHINGERLSDNIIMRSSFNFIIAHFNFTNLKNMWKQKNGDNVFSRVRPNC